MLRVALTGGAASGKSAVAAMLRDLGAFVSQSDEVARGMMQPGEPVYAAIVQHFGAAVVLPGGALDRRALAVLAFQDGRVQELNALVHPPVIAAQTAWLQRVAVEHPTAVAVVESALVLETAFGAEGSTPWRSRFDRIVLVSAPEELRLRRYVARMLLTDPTAPAAAVEADARSRFAAQMPEEQKRALADVTIENDGSLEQLQVRTRQVYARLHQQAEDAVDEAM